MRIAALKEVCRCNGAPNLYCRSAVMVELSRLNSARLRARIQNGRRLSRRLLAPAFKARMLGVAGWYSTNILGNRDGEVLDDPESFKTRKSRSSAC